MVPKEDTLTPEQRLLHDIFSNQHESETMNITQATRKTFTVDAVQITEENMQEVAEWCGGRVRTLNGSTFIKVKVTNPMTDRQTQGFIGDWVLYSGKGYKVYTQKAFERNFDLGEESSESTVVHNVFDQSTNVNTG